MTDDDDGLTRVTCVVTKMRLNRYEVIKIRNMNFVREMILCLIRTETLRHLRYFRIGVMCWNFGAWTTDCERAFWICWRRCI